MAYVYRIMFKGFFLIKYVWYMYVYFLARHWNTNNYNVAVIKVSKLEKE